MRRALRLAAGALPLVLGALGVWADFHSAWLLVRAGSGLNLTWHDLVARNPGPYEQALLVWPPVALAVSAASGALLLFSQSLSARKSLEQAAAAALAGSGLVLAILEARWFGFYFSRLADPGPSVLHLPWIHYAHLAVGACTATLGAAWATSGRSLRGAASGARPLVLLAAFAGALLLMPILPFGVEPESGFHYDELTLASLATTTQPDVVQVTWDLQVIRGALWGGLALALAICAVDALAPRRKAVLWVLHGALAIPIGLGCWHAGRLPFDVLAMPAGPSYGPNILPQLSLSGIAGLWAWIGMGRWRAPRT